MSERSLCILASMGWGVRNVLMSRAMDVIARRTRVHIVSPYCHVDGFRERFGHQATLHDLEPFSLTMPMRFWQLLTMKMFYQLTGSSTHRYKLSAELKGRLDKVTSVAARHLASHRRLAFSQRRLIGRIRRTPAYARAREFVRREGLDLVVSSNPLNLIEYPTLIAARDLGIETAAIITSWDNLSSKRPLVIEFDRYLVWNQLMKRELGEYYQIDERRIHEISPLQFDYYFDDAYLDSRQTFCESLELDPARPIVVHSTVTRGLFEDEPQYIERLLEAMKAGRLHGDPSLIVRLHPKRSIKDFASLLIDRRWRHMPVAWTLAGKEVREENDRWCPLDDEIRLLTNTVRHGDVNINKCSTMMLDFAVLGKPAVLISHSASDEPYAYTEYLTHLKPVMECGGHPVAFRFEESVEHLNRFLREPALHAEGRSRLVEMVGGSHLGRAWTRLAEVLLGEPVSERMPEVTVERAGVAAV